MLLRSRALLVVAAAACLAATPETMAADPAFAPFADEPAILAYLSDPAAVTKAQARPLPAEAIALSNLAEACVHRVVAPGADAASKSAAYICADRVATVMIERFMAGNTTGEPPFNNLQLTHLVIVLSAAEFVAGPARFDPARHDLLVRAADLLAARLADDPDGVPISYNLVPGRWPADAAASIYAVWLADHVSPRSGGRWRWKEPARLYLAWQSGRGVAPDWGLPVSEVSGSYPTSNLPRGSALSWTIRYQAEWDPAGALRLYNNYKALYYVDGGFAVGFREFPPGIDRAKDADSGPIVGGAGAAATAFGIGASGLVGDTFAHERLWATAVVLTNGYAQIPGGEVANGLLARSIAVNQALLTPWFRAAGG
ncbi:hypothetical protein LBMAG42_54830 [Deltaproteobacteria bacterium]|nr:hypothetical protein LBMAG42_54830 [Deltaproteobacteria bacterium]